MKIKFLFIPLVALAACKQPSAEKTIVDVPITPLQGTWKLISAVKIIKADTAITYPEKGQEDEMIKVINGDHFAFFKHDLKKGGKPIFDSGAGTYSLTGDNYTENLQYCNYREWEGHSFNFKVSFKGDTLQQKGIEKIDSLKIDQEIVETYIRIKK
ncbi:lipocalin-like domain-containing protein [Mucilaginibacter pankratovii]|uniref:lipocalin family protein n=1 Tax=Mucilaginibacter pankratovii TaxID=2772110 RepID=UPI001CD0DD72|nr:lipocalin family protein [Mucilaginibacter pankratovii]